MRCRYVGVECDHPRRVDLYSGSRPLYYKWHRASTPPVHSFCNDISRTARRHNGRGATRRWDLQRAACRSTQTRTRSRPQPRPMAVRAWRPVFSLFAAPHFRWRGVLWVCPLIADNICTKGTYRKRPPPSQYTCSPQAYACVCGRIAATPPAAHHRGARAVQADARGLPQVVLATRQGSARLL